MPADVNDVLEVGRDVATESLSFTHLFMQADIVVKLVMVLLLFASLWCWALIYEKWKSFKLNKERMGRFEKGYRSSKALSQLYSQCRQKIDNPMTAMFVAGMLEVKEGMLKDISKMSPEMRENAKERVFFAIQRVRNRALEKFEKQLIFLATVGGAAPFVGLFGTVWGIVNSFQAIAETKNTTLAVVAPGIAEALLATGIGLFAAIPAVIFYNYFSNEIRRIAIRLDDFTNELSVILVYSPNDIK